MRKQDPMEEEEEGACSVELGFGIGGGEWRLKNPVQLHDLFPLRTKEEAAREKISSKEGVQVVKAKSKVDGEEENEGGRKKLRLTKEQLVLLEDSFRAHNILHPTQKQELAKQLNLRPRQVEVWFQNRRARTKMKQTEVDCEFLRKCCESLSNENQRLRRELQQLQSARLSGRLPTASTLVVCAACKKTKE